MNGAAVSRDHQVILCGLEVLRLMGERVASRQDVDGEDIHLVLAFMRDVAHRCLDNAEELFRGARDNSRLKTVLTNHLTNHGRARHLFAKLTHAANPVMADEFVPVCGLYTNLLADLIFEERRALSDLAFDPPALTQFHETEHEIRAAARRHGQILHRLETKYTSPHCI
ncbi:MAG: hypothetical protein DMG13_01850 [Acidobacteria bacterium]|nr:MAG: hypothetical protein DMG13_01850 [Acidobacteriota bacterium]